jgi:hypothetical protein
MTLTFPGIKLDERSLSLRKQCDVMQGQLDEVEVALVYLTASGGSEERKSAKIIHDVLVQRIAAIEREIIHV